MADFITAVFNILTCSCGGCFRRADSICIGDNLDSLRADSICIGGNLDSLKNASDELNSRYLDVKKKVETAETNPDPELKVLNEVWGWMGRVEVLQIEVNTILQQGDREIQEKCARDLFEELPVDETVGVESTFEELCSCFQNDEVGIIGLYGMGGVGKTILLKKFSNDFLSTIGDYLFIWVVASKDADLVKIQYDIMKKFHVQDDNWNDRVKDDGKARLLYQILKKKKFVLLLDDVWERIDLLKLGFLPLIIMNAR
ncbi:hypothetical protein K1719_032471 [Acacia pycnantha]|nr:hypothetical protein K1719_032471 [Acacia pycnantha]